MCFPKSVKARCHASIPASVIRHRKVVLRCIVSGIVLTTIRQEIAWCRSKRHKERFSMARPIALELPPRNPAAELRTRLDNASAEHGEALLTGYEVLQVLQ